MNSNDIEILHMYTHIYIYIMYTYITNECRLYYIYIYTYIRDMLEIHVSIYICKGRYTGFNRFQVFIVLQPYIGCLVEMTSMTVLLGWVVLTCALVPGTLGCRKGDGQSTFIGITLW